MASLNPQIRSGRIVWFACGPLAQLGERLVRNQEVASSSLARSTTPTSNSQAEPEPRSLRGLPGCPEPGGPGRATARAPASEQAPATSAAMMQGSQRVIAQRVDRDTQCHIESGPPAHSARACVRPRPAEGEVMKTHDCWFALPLVAVLLASSARAAVTPASSEPVRTESGLVQGRAESGVVSWKGVPYAAPPVGELRWRAPQTRPGMEGRAQGRRLRQRLHAASLPERCRASRDASGRRLSLPQRLGSREAGRVEAGRHGLDPWWGFRQRRQLARGL